MTPVPSNPESKTPRDFSGEPAVIEYSHESMRYEKDGSGTRELRSRIRVQSNAGLSAAGQLVFDYNALNEQLDIRSIRVIRKDGTTVSVGADAVQDLNAPVARSAPMYSDARQKHVTVPGLSVGDSVEYDVVVSERPFVAGHFWHVWAFNAQTISLDDQLELNVPKALALKVKSPPGLAPAVSVERDRQIYRWTTSNFKTSEPIDLFSNFTFDVTKSLEGVRPATSPRVMFSTFQNWAEVADWYAQLERDRRVPTPEIRAKADEITRGLQNDEDKARAIYYWVSQNVRYVALAFGLARYQPHAAAEVLSNRYGDCKDKTTLLEALLEAKGLHPRSALVNLNAEIDPEFPNPAQFDHVIAVLKTSTGDTWMDTTLGVAPFAYLLPQLRGSQALVVSQLPPKTLTKLPPTLPFAPEYALTVDGNVDSAGALDGDVQLQTRGDLSVLIRLVNDHVSPEQLAKIADSILARTNRFLYGSPRYTDFRLINPQDTSEPLKVRFHVTGKPIFVNPKATRAELLQTIGYGVANLLGSLKLLPSAGNQGSSPSAPGSVLSLGGPISYALALNLTFADLASSEVPDPRNFHVSRDFAEFQSKNFWQDQTFHSHTSLQVRAPEIPLTSANDLMAFETSIKDVFPIPSKPSVGTEPPFGSSKAPAPAKYVPSPAVQDLYKRGEDESKRKNWSNAIDAFRSATLADPHYADAWRELGRARMYAHQFSDAEAAFRKYLELSPADHLAYLNMAWVLYNEKKFEEDRDLMLKRLASAPEDGDALFRLGVAYLALRQPAQAVPVLEKSTDRFPRYLAAQMALARAYLETHQDLSAQKSLRRAVAIDGGDGTLNSAAYLLSEHRVSLQTAEEWSHQSIEIVEKELNDSSLASLQAGTWALIMKLSHYWDTMGWIKFQQGQTDAAEKYVLAAYQINDEPIVDFHLGRIYEARDRTREATGAYLSSLRSVPPTGNFEETVKEVRERLAALLGGDAQVDQRLTAFHGEGAPARSTTVANPTGQQGITQYSLIIGPNSRIVDLSPITHDDPLAKLSGELRSTPLPQSFPDNELTKLPRLGTLTCVANDQPCTFALVPGSLASRVAPLD